MSIEEPFEESSVDFIPTLDGGTDQCMDGDLIDVSRGASGDLEDLPDGWFGKQVGVALCSLDVKAEVVLCVLEAEGAQVLSEGEAGSHGLEEILIEDIEEVFDAADEQAESVLGVEVVDGQAPQDVGDLGGHAFGVVDDDDGVSAAFLLV